MGYRGEIYNPFICKRSDNQQKKRQKLKSFRCPCPNGPTGLFFDDGYIYAGGFDQNIYRWDAHLQRVMNNFKYGIKYILTS